MNSDDSKNDSDEEIIYDDPEEHKSGPFIGLPDDIKPSERERNKVQGNVYIVIG